MELSDINEYQKHSGRVLKEDNDYENIADLLEAIYSRSQDIRLLKNLDKINGVIPITIFSWSDTISTAQQTVWRAGGDQAQYVIKYTADTCTIVSDDAEDGAGTQTGILTVKVSGILNDYTAASEVVTLNGTTPVTLTNEYLAINEMNPETAGSTKTAQGNIDVLYSDGDILARIPESDPCPFNISYQAVFTAPLGTTFKINKVVASSGSNDEIIVNLFVVNPVNEIPVIQETLLIVAGESDPLDGTFITVPEKHTVFACARSTLGVNKNVSVSIAGDLLVNSIIDDVIEYSL